MIGSRRVNVGLPVNLMKKKIFLRFLDEKGRKAALMKKKEKQFDEKGRKTTLMKKEEKQL